MNILPFVFLLIAVYAVNPSLQAELCKKDGESADIDCIATIPSPADGKRYCLVDSSGKAAGCVEAGCPDQVGDTGLKCESDKCCCKATDLVCNDPEQNKDVICAASAMPTVDLCTAGSGNTGGSTTATGVTDGNTGGGSGMSLTCYNTSKETSCTGEVCKSDLTGKPKGCGDLLDCRSDEKRKVTETEAYCLVDKGFCCCITANCNHEADEILQMSLPPPKNSADGLAASHCILVFLLAGYFLALKTLMIK